MKLKKYDEAANAIRREISMHQRIEHTPSVGRLAVVLVLVQLARGDQVAAEKAFREWGNCCDDPEVFKIINKIENGYIGGNFQYPFIFKSRCFDLSLNCL